MNALEKLREIVTGIREPGDPLKIVDDWKLARRLLRGMPVDRERAGSACEARDIDSLENMVSELEGIASGQGKADRGDQGPAVADDVMASALRAFRKRLKLGRLADESKLGGRYTSGGKQSERDAIIPPDSFGPEVWKALERAGKLRHTGQGFYCEP